MVKRIVTGILAHVDSGKTTLSEGMLYLSGAIRNLGRVDHGNTFLDTHSIEKDRGITIFSKQAIFSYKDTEFTLLDTPGHVDFSAETERTLSVLDYAVLVISASDGVQSHTETLWKLLRTYNVPTFLFINKMDIAEKNKNEILGEIEKRLDHRCVNFSVGESEDFFESIAMCDETLMESYLKSGDICDDEIREAIAKRRVFPCFFGAALKTSGVEEFLSGFAKYTQSKKYPDKFGARVFKIAEDDKGNRLTYAKITGGSIRVKSLLTKENSDGEEWSEKINQIRIYSGQKYECIDEATAGMVCAFTGLSKTFPGEGFGFEADTDKAILEPVLTYSVILPRNTDVNTALAKLHQLEQEDPQLHVVWNEHLQEISVQLMGEIQLEVIKRIAHDRFGMDIEFGHGGIVYKETILDMVEGVGHYEPLRHYAEVHLILEKAERGSGIQLATNCSEDELDRNWQRLIMTHLMEKEHVGVLTGSPITDVKITLVAGRAHNKHTEGGDFRQATYRAVRHGLKMAKSVLLEPWYEFSLEIPTDNVGRAMTDIQQMGGNFESPETHGDMSIICGSAPVSEMRDYHKEVIGYTHGLGRLMCTVKGYFPCHNCEEIIEKIGYDSEGDVENTADSVFCSHGAGFVVKWDKVHEYMHIESCLKKENTSDNDRVTTQQVTEYIDRVAEDKELIKIFERTYGPIQRRAPEALYTKKTPSAVKMPKPKPFKKGDEYLLVDGYNIIFAWENLREIAKENLDLAREQLTNILCNYGGFKQCKIILVFDAYKVKGNHREIEEIDNISVVYTKEAETADTYIERVTHELSKNNNVRVATSDGLEQLIILGNGAYRISAEAFFKEVRAVEDAIREFLKS